MNGGQLAGGNSKSKKADIKERVKEYMKDICSTCTDTENCSSRFAACLIEQSYIDGLYDGYKKIKELEAKLKEDVEE